ncbi:hypothetical protein [Streptomyces sp. NPDC050982]|uniref:hypothetical protein n=1 Tax=Streptomyces sp. NPDC050982 TaxID=3154746 RepID=UPI0033E6058F
MPDPPHPDLDRLDNSRAPAVDTAPTDAICAADAIRPADAIHRVLPFRVDTDAIADPDLEPALLAAEFCPRTP